jgi:membrane protease subunit HflC
MSSRLFPLFIALGVLLIFVAFSLFSVNETEYAIRTRFGAIIDTRYHPGLHLKWPWDMVTKFDRRVLSESYNGETFLTNDGRNLIVDFYVMWRVKDPTTYYTNAAGSEAVAGVSPRSSRTASRAWSRSGHCSRSSPPSARRSPPRCLDLRA